MNGNLTDIFIIGGGINGCGIARDATGRGKSVILVEEGDLAQATSSASSKLFHGGLRYLEYYEFRLVREALKERETLLRAMPHISWPMRFVLPHHKGLRPRWLLRLGLFLYDYLGGRKILPPAKTLQLQGHVAGAPLKSEFMTGFEYSDCWVQDSRLVVLNARDAVDKGAKILTRTKMVNARRYTDHWEIECENVITGERQIYHARIMINAAGPWIMDVLTKRLGIRTKEKIRLVRGSHIVVRRLFNHDQPYILQGSDGRIVFVIPYERDFTLIGTTDADHESVEENPACTEEEADYLCEFVSNYFEKRITKEDIVWSYSGVRPLYDDGAGEAQEATRDYVLSLNEEGATLLNIFGGKITTYRKLAEAALDKLNISGSWTADAPLPGGDFEWNGAGDLIKKLMSDYAFLDEKWANRLIYTYGTRAWDVLGTAGVREDLGEDFGASLTKAEIIYLLKHEFAQTGEDILWRRTKLA